MKKSLLMISTLTLGLLQTESASARNIEHNYYTSNMNSASDSDLDNLLAELTEKQAVSKVKTQELSSLVSDYNRRVGDKVDIESARSLKARQAFRDSEAKRYGSSKLNSSAAPVIAARRASNASHSSSRGWCAKYVRRALQAAGYKFTPNASAYQYATRGTLAKAGFSKINNNSAPQVGDVVVISRSSKHKHGHIAIYDGRNWVSDFRQKSKSPYRDSYNYTTWRDSRYLNDASQKGLYLAMNDND